MDWDRSLWGYAALGLLALGVYLWLEIPWTPQAPPLPRLQAGREGDRAVDRRPHAALDYPRLMSILRPLAENPAARAFARDFRREPTLDSLWRRLENDKDAEAFVAALRVSPAFGPLLARHGREPAFKALVEAALTRHPDAAAYLRPPGY
ncbi:MAG: hypothetical protein HY553_20780 [Elusimicrobia bacterium]|nr:hypothetical protein [Elusimicrobiota bacterium]